MFEKWSSPESVFQILKALSRDQPCDITGIRDYQMIDNAGGIQRPLPDTSNDAAASKEMNSLDAKSLDIEANQKVLLASRRGPVTATACITNTVRAGQVFVPVHYSVANDLAFPAFDPYSRQPPYKACAVSVTPL